VLRERERCERTDLVGRRLAGASFTAVPIIVANEAGEVIAGFRSSRKLGKAIVAGELVLGVGDQITVGYRAGVVS
jgi:hypothetical protein